MKFLFGEDSVIRLSSSVKTAQPEAARALEEAWLKRRQELAGWQPSNGWLIEQKPSAKTTSPHSR